MKKILGTLLSLTMLTACIPMAVSAGTKPGQTQSMLPPDAQYMVSGLLYSRKNGELSAVVLSRVKDGKTSGKKLAYGMEYFPQEPRIGDFVQNCVGIGTTLPPENVSLTEPVTLLGNGLDLYGEDFTKVLREDLLNGGTLFAEYNYEEYFSQYNIFTTYVSDYDIQLGGIIPGDTDEDESLSILDVVKVNRHIMIGEPMICYAKLAADVNRDGVVDETDSLNILKAVLGILPDFAELTE